MNRGVITTGRSLAAAVALLLPAVAAAQPSSIRIKQGESLEYNVRAEIEVTELTGTREAMLRAVTGGVAQLRARRVSRQKIEWSYETPEVHLVQVTGELEPGGSTETTIRSKPGKLSTDARGRVVSGLKRSNESESLLSMMEAMHRNLVQHWFQPAIFRKMKPGDRWSENRDEQIRVDAMGIDVRTRYAIAYTFDGIVDTLGGKAIRVRWSATEMEIDGTRTLDGMTSPVVGDGDHFGTSYFSTIDGLLLASTSENSVDIRVNPVDRGGAVVPMTWRLRTESIRRPG